MLFWGFRLLSIQISLSSDITLHNTNSCGTLQTFHISKHLKNNDAELVVTTQSFRKPYTNFDSQYFRDTIQF